MVEEGPRYKFGTVEAESELRDFNAEHDQGAVRSSRATGSTPSWSRTRSTGLNEVAGARGYAFADVSPDYRARRRKAGDEHDLPVGETPRVYVERINIQGNTVTRDKVIRREFRLNEGDAFNAFKVKRSQDRIQSLGFSRKIWRSSRPRARRPTGSS